tara:strand:- start:263 stop:601 length:339 start_codon:yes stop_codon:yes gene_type:complete
MNEKYHAFEATISYTNNIEGPKTITGMALMPKLGLFHNFIIVDTGKTQTCINMAYIISIECNLDDKFYTPVQVMEDDFILNDKLKEIEFAMKTKELDRAVAASSSEAPANMY